MYEIKQKGTTVKIFSQDHDRLVIKGNYDEVICFNEMLGETDDLLTMRDFMDRLVERTGVIWNNRLWVNTEVNNRHPVYEFKFKLAGIKNINADNAIAKKIALALTVTRAVSPDRILRKNIELVNGEYSSDFWLPVLSKKPQLIMTLLANPVMQKTFLDQPGIRKAYVIAALEADPFLVDQLPDEVLLHPRDGNLIIKKAIDVLLGIQRRSKEQVIFDIPSRLYNSPAISQHVLFEIKEAIEQDKMDTIDWKRLQPVFGKDKEIRDILAHSTGFVNWLESHLTVSDRGINRALWSAATNGSLNMAAAHHLPWWIDKELMSTICANFAGMESSNIYRVLAMRIIQDRS